MNKIVFLKEPGAVYDGEFIQIGRNQIRLIFANDVPSKDVLLSGFNLVNEYNGLIETRCTDYIHIYRTYEDPKKVELCNDNIPWVAPEITIQFVVGAGGTLVGEAVQHVNRYEDLTIPTVQTEAGYQFVKWSPEIPSEGVVEKDRTFRAVVIDKNVYFHCSGGGQLDGEIKQFVNDYSELEIPSPIANKDFKFVGWMPEIPEEGTVECTNFYAIFESNIPDRLETVETEITDTQLGLVENYDFALTTYEEVTDLQLALVEVYDLLVGGEI